MQTSNPLLKRERAFITDGTQMMTLDGTVLKCGILLFLCLGSGLYAWTSSGLQIPLMMIGLIGGAVAFLVSMFKADWSPVLAPVYAIMEGLVLGGISYYFNRRYPGIVVNATMLTFAVLGFMLLLYVTRIIRVTAGLRTAIISATLAVALIYLVDIVLGIFGIRVPFIHETGLVGIIASLVITGIAAFNFLLDFDSIEQGVQQGAPSYMEWYCSMALLVTLIWVYLEILDLLSKLRGRD